MGFNGGCGVRGGGRGERRGNGGKEMSRDIFLIVAERITLTGVGFDENTSGNGVWEPPHFSLQILTVVTTPIAGG